MAGVITTGNNPKLLFPGLKALFGTTYNDIEMMSDQIFEQMDSDKAYEEVQELTGFGYASVKTEGGSIVYTSAAQGPTARFTNVTYGLGFQETEESVEDNQYKGKATDKTKALARSLKHTRETILANVLNRAFSNSYLGADGVRLVSTAHPTVNGTQSNTLTADADLSEAALEDMLINIQNATDSTGLRIGLKGQKLIVAPNEKYNAIRILKSAGQSGNANNDINAIKDELSIVVWPFQTDADQWGVKTNIEKGLMVFNRRATSFDKDSDFDTGNYKHKGTFRMVGGWGDFRTYYASQGA